jgi:hypothetical protein
MHLANIMRVKLKVQTHLNFDWLFTTHPIFVFIINKINNLRHFYENDAIILEKK